MVQKEMLSEAVERFLESGDKESFALVMRGYTEGLLGFINSTVNDFHTAEDLAQDVFVELWFNRKRFKRKSSLKSYLYSIGRHKALDYIKKHSRAVNLEDGAVDSLKSADAAEDMFFRSERDKAILQAFASLPQDKREVLYLLYFEQMSFDEISYISGLPKEKLYSLAKRAKAELKINIDINIE